MTNRGQFIGTGTEIYWFKQLYGFLTVSDVCMPRCVIPPLFHILGCTRLQSMMQHNLPIMKIKYVISVRDLDI